jgi:hypothetical protein
MFILVFGVDGKGGREEREEREETGVEVLRGQRVWDQRGVLECFNDYTMLIHDDRTC